MARAKTQQANRRGTNRGKTENRARPDGGTFDPRKSSVKRLADWNQGDIHDEQDEFFEGLDKVSLQQTTRDPTFDNDLEIPEQLLDIDDAQSDDEQDYPQDDESEVESKPRRQRKVKSPIDNSRKGRFGKLHDDGSSVSEGELEGSDKMQLDEQANKEQEFDENADSEDDELTWKSYHVTKSKSKKKKLTSNDPEAIREEEERRALELEEVKRLQAKARSKLITTDFSSYLDYASDEELVPKTNDKEDSRDQSSLLVKEFHSDPEAIAYLLRTKPECLALLDDLRRSLDMLSELQDKLVSDPPQVALEDKNPQERPVIGLLHYQILSTYISNTAFYMHLSLQVPPADPSLLSSVMKSLVELRGTLHLMEQHELINCDRDSEMEWGSGIFDGQYPQDEFDEELQDLLNDQNITELTQLHSTGKRHRSTKSEVEAEMDSKSKVKRRKKVNGKTNGKGDMSQFMQVEDPNLLLQNLPPRPSVLNNPNDLSLSQEANMHDIDFVEPSSLTAKEKSEKEKKKKDLRFYTAKIQAKGKRREKALAGSGGVSGDSDLPYITKEAQRREFLKKQDHHQTSDQEDYQSADQMDNFSNSNNPDSSDYYNTIKELKLSAKKSKKTQYDHQKLAERDMLTRAADGEIDEDGGPRSINRQILKNKGLTPKRAKENRNPRVKKRKRFEKAQQKISSQRPTFKPDQAAQNRSIAGYQGERSGVKVGLVKSRKL